AGGSPYGAAPYAAAPMPVPGYEPGMPMQGQMGALGPVAAPGVAGMAGIDPLAGINGAKQEKGIIGRFKRSTGSKRLMYIVLGLALFYFFFLDDDEDPIIV